MTRMLWIAIALTGCAALFHVDQPVMGADGVPTFQGHDFRHAANTPYFCYEHVTPGGEKTSSCHEIAEWCATALHKTNADGLATLAACQSRPEATCLTFYRGDATQTQCFASPGDCAAGYALYVAPEYGAKRTQLTSCTTIASSWQPAP